MTKLKPKAGDALVEHAHGRTAKVRSRVRTAMGSIEVEIEQNQGIYPFNGGRLSVSEVCRRAGVHKITLQGPKHRDSTKLDIEKWIKSLMGNLITGRKVVRDKVTKRADDWEASYKAVANKFNEMYAIEVIAKDKRIRELTERIAVLDAENLRLQVALSQGKVVRFPHKSAIGTRSPAAKDAGEPCLVLIRGVPGSGKSTLALSYKGHDHFEADMYFIRDGVYTFDPDLLPAAHQWCFQQTRDALSQGRDVVVSNTFANAWEIKPYIDLGYKFSIIEADGYWPSIHGIDRERINRMRSSWVSNAQLVAEVEKLGESSLVRGSE